MFLYICFTTEVSQSFLADNSASSTGFSSGKDTSFSSSWGKQKDHRSRRWNCRFLCWFEAWRRRFSDAKEELSNLGDNLQQPKPHQGKSSWVERWGGPWNYIAQLINPIFIEDKYNVRSSTDRMVNAIECIFLTTSITARETFSNTTLPLPPHFPRSCKEFWLLGQYG